MSKEGAQHPLLLHADKLVCEFCNGTTFQVKGPSAVENTTLPTTTKAYLWENSLPTLPYGNMQTMTLLCQCGQVMGKLLFCFDLASIMATPVVTATHIACVTTVNNLKGLYLTPLAGTSKGLSFIIASNTIADPTVITVTGAINDDTLNQIFMISSWKVF